MQENRLADNRKSETTDITQTLAWAEICAWMMLVMTPLIWWLQGPSVSTDQFVVRTALVVISALAGIGLRIRAMVSRRRAGRSAQKANEPPAQ